MPETHGFEYTFTGRVIPERVNVSIEPAPVPFKFSQPDSGIECDLLVSVQVSQISAVVLSQTPISDLHTLRNYIHEIVQMELDCYGFVKGYAYLAEIDSCTCREPPKLVVFGVDVSGIGIRQDLGSPDFGEFMRVLLDPQFDERDREQLRLALANYRLAIKNPRDTAMYCYRSIECVWQAFNQNWSALNASLNVDKTWTDEMRENHAQPQRHGKSTFMSHSDRVDMFLRSQQVLDRFRAFIQKGRQQLEASVYPLLKE